MKGFVFGLHLFIFRTQKREETNKIETNASF